MAVNNQTTIEPRAMILKNWSSIIFNKEKDKQTGQPLGDCFNSTADLWFDIFFRMLGGTGSQSSSTEELLIVNLKV